MLQRVFGKTVMPAMVLTAFLLLGSVQPMQASDCEARIRKAERNLERAIRHYGLHSIEAERRRDQLERARARCRR